MEKKILYCKFRSYFSQVFKPNQKTATNNFVISQNSAKIALSAFLLHPKLQGTLHGHKFKSYKDSHNYV
jgi:hypothetical protein